MKTILTFLLTLNLTTFAAQPAGLEWDRLDDATVIGYRIYERFPVPQQTGTFTYTMVGNAVPQTQTGTVPAFTFTGALPVGAHTFVCVAYNADGQSDYSNAVTFNVTVKPAAPQNLRVKP